MTALNTSSLIKYDSTTKIELDCRFLQRNEWRIDKTSFHPTFVFITVIISLEFHRLLVRGKFEEIHERDAVAFLIMITIFIFIFLFCDGDF